MLPDGYDNFMVASATVAGALIGLLFVATAIAPERIVHKKAPALAQETAAGAFILLINTLFVSLASLIPSDQVGTVCIVVSIGGIVGTLLFGTQSFLARSDGGVDVLWWIRKFLVVGLLAWQFATALAINYSGSADLTNQFNNLALIILAFFAIGVERAWNLLGGRGHGVTDAIRAFRQGGGTNP